MSTEPQGTAVRINASPETADYVMNHTMLRVKDPSASLHFYCDLLGMTLLRKLDFEAAEFSLYFVGYVRPDEVLPEDPAELTEAVFSRTGLIELTHNWGTEDEDGPVYHDGNSEPRGFGHLGIAVPDVDAACARFDAAGCSFVKRPNEGRMKGLAFVKDPDGYWIEILSARRQAGK